MRRFAVLALLIPAMMGAVSLAGTWEIQTAGAISSRRPRGWAIAGASAIGIAVLGIACTPTGLAFLWVYTDHIGFPWR